MLSIHCWAFPFQAHFPFQVDFEVDDVLDKKIQKDGGSQENHDMQTTNKAHSNINFPFIEKVIIIINFFKGNIHLSLLQNVLTSLLEVKNGINILHELVQADSFDDVIAMTVMLTKFKTT